MSFESLETLLAMLTPQRGAHLELITARGGFDSVTALATELRRTRSSVHRDRDKLTTAGRLVVRPPTNGVRRDAITPAINAGHLERILPPCRLLHRTATSDCYIRRQQRPGEQGYMRLSVRFRCESLMRHRNRRGPTQEGAGVPASPTAESDAVTS